MNTNPTDTPTDTTTGSFTDTRDTRAVAAARGVCEHPATHYSPEEGLTCAICGSDTPGLEVERPPAVGLWAAEAAAGLVVLAGAMWLLLSLRAAAGTLIGAVFALPAALIGAALVCHATAIARERATLRAMSDAELREVATRARAIEQRHHDVYEPKHSH